MIDTEIKLEAYKQALITVIEDNQPITFSDWSDLPTSIKLEVFQELDEDLLFPLVQEALKDLDEEVMQFLISANYRRLLNQLTSTIALLVTADMNLIIETENAKLNDYE